MPGGVGGGRLRSLPLSRFSFKSVIFVRKLSRVAQNRVPLGIGGSSPLTRTLEARKLYFSSFFRWSIDWLDFLTNVLLDAQRSCP